MVENLDRQLEDIQASGPCAPSVSLSWHASLSKVVNKKTKISHCSRTAVHTMPVLVPNPLVGSSLWCLWSFTSRNYRYTYKILYIYIYMCVYHFHDSQYPDSNPLWGRLWRARACLLKGRSVTNLKLQAHAFISFWKLCVPAFRAALDYSTIAL